MKYVFSRPVILSMLCLCLLACSKGDETPKPTPDEVKRSQPVAAVPVEADSSRKEPDAPAVKKPENEETKDGDTSKQMPEVTRQAKPEEKAEKTEATEKAEENRGTETGGVVTKDREQSPAAAKKISVDSQAMKVLDISERSFDGGNSLAVTFSTPVDASKAFSQYFNVSIKNEGSSEGAWILSDNAKVAYFSNTLPEKTYNVSVSRGLLAANGKKLQTSSSAEVKTRRVSASIAFSSSNHFLPLDMHSGLPVTAINTPEADVDFYRVDPDARHTFLNSVNESTRQRRRSMRHIVKYASQVYSARYEFDAPVNKRREFNLPVQHIDALKEPGLYFAVLEKPEDYYSKVHFVYFAVTDLGVHVRRYEDNYDIYISSLKTGLPVSGVDVKMVDRKGNLQNEVKTTDEGYASLPKRGRQERYIFAEKDDSISIIELKQPALDLSEFDLGKRPQKPFELFVYGPRNLYRPKETVDIVGVLRNADGRLDEEPPLATKLQDPTGRTVKQFSWRPDKAGIYTLSHTLPADAATGDWRMRVSLMDGSIKEYVFKVEEFLPERMKLTFNPGQEDSFIGKGEKIAIDVLGEYLYGAPAAGNRFESRIISRLAREPFQELDGYLFGNVKEEGIKQEFTLDDRKLDASGSASVTVPGRWKSARSPVQITLQGSLFETGGRPVSRRHKTVYWPADTFIGVRPRFEEDKLDNGSMAGFDIIRADKNGKRLEAEDVSIRLIKEDRSYFWTYSSNRGWHYEYDQREYAELEMDVDIEEGGSVFFEAPVDWGHYRLEVREQEDQTLTSYRFRAGYSWWRRWERNSDTQAARPDKVSLALNQKSYKNGDTAKLSIVAPEEGEALVLVESDKLLHMQRVHVPKEGTTLDINIEDDWNRHDIYISVVHLQAADKRNLITPKRSFGLLHLPLDREDRRLQVDILSDDKIAPEQTYKAKVRVDTAHADSQVYLTLAAVDVGVLSITDYETPDPHRYFFEPRRYQVDSLDMYHKLVELNDNALAKQRYGGDAELSRGGKKAQAEVQIVSIFSGLVEVNAKGEAVIPLKIPAFNGRLRLMAVAMGNNTVGSADKEVTVVAPLVTQLAMPRFLAMGDESSFALDIHNMTEETQTLDVKLSSEGPVELMAGKKQLSLAENEKVTLLYPVKAGYESQRTEVKLQISGMPDYEVNRDWGIQVRPAYPAEVKTRREWLKPGESMTIGKSEMSGWIGNTVEMVVNANNRADLNIRSQMHALLRYPYGCLEQSTSSTYPWLYATSDNLQVMGISPGKAKSRAGSLAHGMERIASKQLSNGGYGMWSNNSSERHWLTAYVGDFLTDAKAMGVSVPQEQYEKTIKRLNDYVGKRNGGYQHRWSRDNNHYTFAYRAYAAYVLSKVNQGNLADLRKLADNDADSSKSYLPLLHLAVALQKRGDNNRAQKLYEKASQMDRGNSYYADYGSDIRDTARAIDIYIRNDLDIEKANVLSTKLMEEVNRRRYLSTQERNALFMAAIALEKKFVDEWKAEVEVAGQTEKISSRGNWNTKMQGESLLPGVTIRNTSEGDIYLDVDYQGYSKTKPASVSHEKLSVQRRYYDTKGQPKDVTTLEVGELVVVELDVRSRMRLPDLLLADLLPAGLELENQNLKHAVRLDDIKFEGKKVPYWVKRDRVIHKEYRDDRFVAAINTRYSYHSKIFYLARAVTPGVYQVPAPLLEDMYRPEIRATGNTINTITVVNP